jgi:hypothetical protein
MLQTEERRRLWHKINYILLLCVLSVSVITFVAYEVTWWWPAFFTSILLGYSVSVFALFEEYIDWVVARRQDIIGIVFGVVTTMEEPADVTYNRSDWCSITRGNMRFTCQRPSRGQWLAHDRKRHLKEFTTTHAVRSFLQSDRLVEWTWTKTS